MQQLHDETMTRIHEVEMVITHTLPQMPADATRLQASLARVIAKEKG